MGKIALPETVKSAYAEIGMSTPVTGQRFPVSLGPNEIMTALALYHYFSGAPAAGVNTYSYALWKKSDTNPSSTQLGNFLHSDFAWNVKTSVNFVAESVVTSRSQMVIFPWPLVLVRVPRLVGAGGTWSSIQVGMRLYYLIQEVSDEDLAQLMVKDHA